MYTEYVFDNKKYEVALRDLKATLFDIVTTEESNIVKLRKKTFSATNRDHQKKLEKLFVRQDRCLRSVLDLTSQLEMALQNVDSCSRDLKQIEDENIAQIIAHVREDESVHTMETPVVEQQEAMASQDVSVEEPVKESIVEEPTYEETPTEEYQESTDVASSSMGDSPMNQEVNEFGDEGDSQTVEQENTVSEEPVAEEPPMGDGVSNENVDVDVPAATQNESVDAPTDDVSNPEEDVVMEYDDSLSTVKEEETVEGSKADGEPNSEEDVVMEYDDSLSTVKEEKTEEAKEDVPTVTPSVEMDTSNMTEEEKLAAGLVDPSAPAPTDAPVATDAPAEPVMVPIITSTTDVPNTNDASGSIPVIVPSSASGLEEAVAPTPSSAPIEEAKTEDTASVVNVDGAVETIHFKKRSTDAPKVIMISGKQAVNLRRSQATQEALLSAKGLFKDVSDDAKLEKQLVDNGLLEGDAASKQAQIEKMMNEANALYAAGKVEEAQNMYNQISVLNKELQESEGMTK